MPVVAGLASVSAALLFVYLDMTWLKTGMDTRVYRDGARAFLDRADVYGSLFEGFPFTYPPFALLVFVPLALVPSSVAIFLMFVTSVVALTLVMRWCQEYAAAGRVSSWWATTALVAGSNRTIAPASRWRSR